MITLADRRSKNVPHVNDLATIRLAADRFTDHRRQLKTGLEARSIKPAHPKPPHGQPTPLPPRTPPHRSPQASAKSAWCWSRLPVTCPEGGIRTHHDGL